MKKRKPTKKAQKKRKGGIPVNPYGPPTGRM